MQSDVGCGAVQAVVLGDGDLERRSFREPQGPAEAEHHSRVGQRRHGGSAVGRGMGVDLRRQGQAREAEDQGSAPEVSAQSDAEQPPEPARESSSPVGSFTLARTARPSFCSGTR